MSVPRLACVVLPLLLKALPAAAGCSTDVQPVAFGVIDPKRTTLSNGAVAVNCDKATSFSVAIAPGPGGGDRYLAGPGNQLMVYKLFRDASYTVEWGDGSTAPTVGGSADGKHATTLTIYGALPAQGGFQPGSYRDTLLVTLIF